MENKDIKAIFFDWGNLFARIEGLNESLGGLLKPFDLGLEEFQEQWWKAYLLRSSGKIKSDEEMNTFVQSITKKNIPTKKIINLIVEKNIIPKEHINVVRELKRKYKVAILSNNVKEWVVRVIKNYGIEELFDELIISSEVGVRKPNAIIYFRALEKLSLLPEETIFVSDEVADDLVAATGLGMRTILMEVVHTGNFKENDKEVLKFYKPDFIIKDFKEIIKAVESL